jgi:hypothetical protein
MFSHFVRLSCKRPSCAKWEWCRPWRSWACDHAFALPGCIGYRFQTQLILSYLTWILRIVLALYVFGQLLLKIEYWMGCCTLPPGFSSNQFVDHLRGSGLHVVSQCLRDNGYWQLSLNNPAHFLVGC